MDTYIITSEILGLGVFNKLSAGYYYKTCLTVACSYVQYKKKRLKKHILFGQFALFIVYILASI